MYQIRYYHILFEYWHYNLLNPQNAYIEVNLW